MPVQLHPHLRRLFRVGFPPLCPSLVGQLMLEPLGTVWSAGIGTTTRRSLTTLAELPAFGCHIEVVTTEEEATSAVVVETVAFTAEISQPAIYPSIAAGLVAIGRNSVADIASITTAN